ncbi:MAG: hypothetical protein IJK81_07835, partial [Selenomonadaceae bacterium]|nr:hypothetical protein [Selenomonadaceae bacterium]
LNEVLKMTDQEKFNAELQMKTNLQEAKFNMLVNELKEQRQDIRDMNKKIDDNQKEFIQQLHNNFVQTLIGVGGMMVALGAFLVAVLK